MNPAAGAGAAGRGPGFSRRRAGIVAHLALAFAAVAVFALAAIYMVEHGTLIIVSSDSRPEGPALPAPEVAALHQRIGSVELRSAIGRFQHAVLDRAAATDPMHGDEIVDSTRQLASAAVSYLDSSHNEPDAERTDLVLTGIERQRAQATELVQVADRRRALFQQYQDAFEATDAQFKAALDQSWRILGRVVARRSLIELSHRLDEIRRDIPGFALPGRHDSQQLAAVETHEAAMLEALERFQRSLGFSQGEDWLQQARSRVHGFIELRRALVAADRSQALATERFVASNEALVSLLETPRRELPDTNIEQPVAGQGPVPAPPEQAAVPTRVTAHAGAVPKLTGRRLTLAVISGGILLLLLLVSAAVIARVVGPVSRLMQASRRIAAGDTNVRVPRGGIRELDSLADSFNRMAEQLAVAGRAAAEYQAQLETEVAQRTRQLAHLAEHDPLTELPNRRQLFAQLTTALQAAQSKNAQVGVYFLDLDNFKNLNDSIGHAYGDLVLKSFAQRLAQVAEPYGFAARLGGDEFTMVVDCATSAEQIEQAGQSLVRAFQAPLIVDGHEILTSISIGQSHYPEHAQSAEALLRAADAALFRAKAMGRSQLNVFTPELLEDATARFTTEQGLRRAIERGELALVFQPEVHAGTLEVGLVEALLRWRLPDGRIASPAEFLSVAEESGLIMEISDWVLRSAIEAAANWHHGDWPQARVAINVSARQILDQGFCDRVQELLDIHRLPASCIELELTENILQTGRSTLTAIGRLRESGVGVALDDFGTGYSSIASLEQLPLTRVKLDQSLIAGVDSKPRSRMIAQAIAGLCGNLGLQMTAEGVEREEQLAMLLQLEHSTYLQGFLLSRPLELDAVPGALNDIPARLQSLLVSSQVLRSQSSGRRGAPAASGKSGTRRVRRARQAGGRAN
ncbi:MAG TPA: EAL domain-containing protein [Steroidobacteraceae bacterium]|nr:EAL domain-containing protein [Steroidobacteraceae bacterium]